ncbi:MAG: hypothetical protein Q8R43_03585, partial [Alphaproteobacteria bacterium]|nr:hypothetical protein [Alphaproteobacteria bacterium]
MNNKLLSISYIALTLCTFSTPSAADVTFLGVSANNLMSSANIKMTITSKPDEITMLNISNTGVKGQTGGGSNTPDTRNCVKSMFAKNPPRTIVGGLITHNGSLANMAGSIVGKRGISLNSERFSFPPSTVFGTN